MGKNKPPIYEKKGRPIIRVEKKCWTCAKTFKVIMSRAVKQKYCSLRCSQKRGVLGIQEDWTSPTDELDNLPFKRSRRDSNEEDKKILSGYNWNTVMSWLIDLSERHKKKQLYLESRRGKYS